MQTVGLFRTRTLTVSVARSPERVYEFVRDARNLPRWSFFESVAKAADEEWLLETADGPVKLRFVQENALGVLDHQVALSTGAQIYVPMRVIPNGDGAEVLFTLFHRPDGSDEAFEADARQVERDLAKLKAVLEELGSDDRA